MKNTLKVVGLDYTADVSGAIAETKIVGPGTIVSVGISIGTSINQTYIYIGRHTQEK